MNSLKSIFMFGSKRDIFEVRKINNEDFIAPIYISNIEFADIGTCTIPNEVINVLSDIYKLESVCYYYIYACNCYRVFNKGGQYSTDKSRGFAIQPVNNEIDFLINYYDARLKNQSLLTNIGTFSNEVSKYKSAPILVFLHHNLDSKRQDELTNIIFQSDAESFNFLVSSINLSDYYEFIQKFNTIIFQKYNFYIEDVLSIILYFSYSLAEEVAPLLIESDNIIKNMTAIRTMQRAYTLIEDSEINLREYVDLFKQTHSTLFPQSPGGTIKNILNAYNFLFFQTGNYDSLETELLKGCLFNKITKDKIVVDFTAFIPILQNFLTSFLSVDGDYGNLASTDLEEKVNKKIIELYGREAAYLRGEIKNSRRRKKRD